MCPILPPTPVSVSEITFLIGQLKKGNAAGADLIPPKVMKKNRMLDSNPDITL